MICLQFHVFTNFFLHILWVSAEQFIYSEHRDQTGHVSIIKQALMHERNMHPINQNISNIWGHEVLFLAPHNNLKGLVAANRINNFIIGT